MALEEPLRTKEDAGDSEDVVTSGESEGLFTDGARGEAAAPAGRVVTSSFLEGRGGMADL